MMDKIKWNTKNTVVQFYFRNNAHVDVENLLKYPLEPVYLALGNSHGTMRKKCKSKLYHTEMYNLVTVDKSNLPGHDVMNTYFLDLAAVVRTQLKDCFTIRHLTREIFHSVPDQFSST